MLTAALTSGTRMLRMTTLGGAQGTVVGKENEVSARRGEGRAFDPDRFGAKWREGILSQHSVKTTPLL